MALPETQQPNSGKLYVVGTPIGNLGDMTPRAVATLREADFIAAEDTRVTAKLLNHFAISRPVVSYYEHNLRERGEQILSRILAGENCAIVTDAGMPCVSDPGADLVRLCADAGVEVIAVPAASAAIAALAVSGLDTSRFSFEGFLSTSKKSRREHLEEAALITRTLIFYEAPHKLIATLADMRESFGDRKIALCRELTKLHEEVIRTTLSGACAYYAGEERSPRGEYVLVIEGAARPAEPQRLTLSEAAKLASALIEGGARPSDACKQIARETGYKKSELYNEVLRADLSL